MLSNEVLGRGGPDYFLSNPPMQPKKEIGDYVENQGILVPKRFASLAEALSSGKPFIARSEHPQDYAGASDLLYSPKVYSDRMQESSPKPTELDWSSYNPWVSLDSDEFRDLVLSQLGNVRQEEFEANLKLLSAEIVRRHCRIMRISVLEFLSQASYSYWELLPGYNRTIIADNAIRGRYHIITTMSEENNQACGYTVVEGGKVVADSSRKLPLDLIASIPSLISLYESVRRLERFNGNHCPIIETQTVGQDHYFLQYHRATDSNTSSFILDREPEDGEIEATFVRGATPKEGLVLRLNFHTSYDKKLQVAEEDAGFDLVNNWFRGIMARKRKLHVVIADNIHHISQFLADSPHLTVSEMFKSLVCLAISKKDRHPFVRGFYGSEDKPVDQFDIRVISDGKKAYIKRLD